MQTMVRAGIAGVALLTALVSGTERVAGEPPFKGIELSPTTCPTPRTRCGPASSISPPGVLTLTRPASRSTKGLWPWRCRRARTTPIRGKALFFDAYGVLLGEVEVGALPDMITFTPNGRFVLTANEGQPNQAYTKDPEGSVSVIDVTGGVTTLTAADVVDVGFAAFNGTALDPSICIFGPAATVAQDLEPEYIAVSHDSRTAWVTLQENNAIAPSI